MLKSWGVALRPLAKRKDGKGVTGQSWGFALATIWGFYESGKSVGMH
jgi:hypothetical protein